MAMQFRTGVTFRGSEMIYRGRPKPLPDSLPKSDIEGSPKKKAKPSLGSNSGPSLQRQSQDRDSTSSPNIALSVAKPPTVLEEPASSVMASADVGSAPAQNDKKEVLSCKESLSAEALSKDVSADEQKMPVPDPAVTSIQSETAQEQLEEVPPPRTIEVALGGDLLQSESEGIHNSTPSRKCKKPVSERKIKANRENAKKSTGPVTERGKNASKLNATTFGLTARANLLPTESKSQRRQLEDLMFKEWRPAGALEELCAREIIRGIWEYGRLQRGAHEYLESLLFDEWSSDRMAKKADALHVDFMLKRWVSDEEQDKVAARIDRRRQVILRGIQESVDALKRLQRERAIDVSIVT